MIKLESAKGKTKATLMVQMANILAQTPYWADRLAQYQLDLPAWLDVEPIIAEHLRALNGAIFNKANITEALHVCEELPSMRHRLRRGMLDPLCKALLENVQNWSIVAREGALDVDCLALFEELLGKMCVLFPSEQLISNLHAEFKAWVQKNKDTTLCNRVKALCKKIQVSEQKEGEAFWKALEAFQAVEFDVTKLKSNIGDELKEFIVTTYKYMVEKVLSDLNTDGPSPLSEATVGVFLNCVKTLGILAEQPEMVFSMVEAVTQLDLARASLANHQKLDGSMLPAQEARAAMLKLQSLLRSSSSHWHADWTKYAEKFIRKSEWQLQGVTKELLRQEEEQLQKSCRELQPTLTLFKNWEKAKQDANFDKLVELAKTTILQASSKEITKLEDTLLEVNKPSQESVSLVAILQIAKLLLRWVQKANSSFLVLMTAPQTPEVLLCGSCS